VPRMTRSRLIHSPLPGRLVPLAVWGAVLGMLLPTAPLGADSPAAPSHSARDASRPVDAVPHAAQPDAPPFAPVAPHPAQQDDPHRICDVELDDARRVHCLLTDVGGVPLSERTVIVVREGRPVATAMTDGRGEFSVGGLSGGVYHLASPGAERIVRVWTRGTAPPTAVDRVQLVASDDLVRGQWDANQWISLDTLTAIAIVAAAFAIPIAVHNAKRARS
jgi:hypothetical protein